MLKTRRYEIYCGLYAGPAYWKMQWDWVFEPDECGHEFITEIEDECLFDSMQIECPKCGGELDIFLEDLMECEVKESV